MPLAVLVVGDHKVCPDAAKRRVQKQSVKKRPGSIISARVVVGVGAFRGPGTAGWSRGWSASEGLLFF